MARQNSRILVAGTGVTGGEVLRQLIDSEMAPYALVRNPAKAAPIASLGIERIEADFANPESWDRALAGMDAER